MAETNIFGLAPASQIFVPVRAVGCEIVDNGGDTIAHCFTPQMAASIAELMTAPMIGEFNVAMMQRGPGDSVSTVWRRVIDAALEEEG